MRKKETMGKGIMQPDAIERRHFAGFPGEYGPGVVVPLETTGLTEDEARARIKAENLPLRIVPLKEEKGGEQ